MGRLKTQQARSLWTKAIIQFIGSVLLYTLLFFFVIFGFGLTAFANFGDWVADRTSSWTYMAAEELDDFLLKEKINTDNIQIMELPSGVVMDYEDWDNWGRGLYTLNAAVGIDYYETENSEIKAASVEDLAYTVAYRDLGLYYELKSFKWVFVALLYFLGLMVLALFLLRKPIRSIDAIAQAISSPSLAEGDPIELPERLKPIQSEIELLQMRIVHNEMAARMADERKNELVTYLAHDIRTPMTSVMGYLELISETEGMPAEKQREYAERALAKAGRLNGLVEELFEITRYNMQHIPIERETLDVELLCQQIAEEFFPQAQEKNLRIKVGVAPGLTAFLDPSRMGRVLENILKNAMAFATEGSEIVISAQLNESDELPLAISVCNEGKEISPLHLEHIFDRFYRADAARGQNTGGAGLGLAIAKEIVEAHSGSIMATSEKGVTCFTIELPA